MKQYFCQYYTPGENRLSCVTVALFDSKEKLMESFLVKEHIGSSFDIYEVELIETIKVNIGYENV